MAAERVLQAADFDCGLLQFGGGGEPALFLKLFIVGQVGLGDDSQDVAFLKSYSRIDKPVLRTEGNADDGQYIEVRRVAGQLEQCFFCIVQ